MKKLTIFFSALLIFTFFFVGSSFAADDFTAPDFPTNVGFSDYEYIIFRDFSGIYRLYVFPRDGVASGSNIKAYKYDDTLLSIENLNSSKKIYFVKYKIDYGEWSLREQTNTVDTPLVNLPMTDQFELIESSMNIYTSRSSDEVFFPVAPTQSLTVEEMIAQETPVMAEKITQAMGQILIIAVGSLALLISLVVLFKVFWIYRVR